MDIWEFISSQHFCWSHRWLWRLQFTACSHWSVETTHCGFPGVSSGAWHRIIHLRCPISAMLCHWVFALSHQSYLLIFQARRTQKQFCKFRLRDISLEPKVNNTDWPRNLSSRERAMESYSECVEALAAHTNDNPRELTPNPNSGIPIIDLQNSINPHYFRGQSWCNSTIDFLLFSILFSLKLYRVESTDKCVRVC